MAITQRKLALQICEAQGIDPSTVNGMKLILGANDDIAFLEVLFVTTEATEQLIAEVDLEISEVNDDAR